MPIDRLKVGAHLRWIRLALKKSARELSLGFDWPENDWNQFESDKYDRTITIDKAVQIREEYGISLDWLYLGERFSQLPGDLQDGIRAAREAEAAEVSAPKRAKSRP